MNISKKILVGLALLSTSIGSAYAIPADDLYQISVRKPGNLAPFYQAHSKVPFTKSFSNLSEAQQVLVKNKFENLAANDIPPYPTHGSGKLYRPLLKVGALASLTGTLKVQATIGTDGQVRAVNIEGSPNEYLSKKITRIVSSTAFDAASCGGQSCEMNFPIEIQFN